MDAQQQVSWLARRATFGLAPGELDRRVAQGAAAWLDELLHVEPARTAPLSATFTTASFEDTPTSRRADAVVLADAWFGLVHSTAHPLQAAMAWFWHDHFAVSLQAVSSAIPFARYLGLLHDQALGDFRRLIREVTLDAAMLQFLDGASSTAASPNENFGRELLELYTLGVGAFTEHDVRAAASALTGWVVRPRLDHRVQFVPGRHAAAPQVLLGRTVRDVDTVVDAVVSHEACASFLAAKLAAWFLGPDHDRSLHAGFAKTFRDHDLAIAPLVHAVLSAGLDGRGGELVLAPFPWLSTAQRALGVRLDAGAALRMLALAGQMPLQPPNVGGWPGPHAWLGTSATAARVALASALVDASPPSSPVLRASEALDLEALAALLGLPTGFSVATTDALRSLHRRRPGGRSGSAVAAVALASADMVLA
jgi:uncharacterized protein (DUF1800 family)